MILQVPHTTARQDGVYSVGVIGLWFGENSEAVIADTVGLILDADYLRPAVQSADHLLPDAQPADYIRLVKGGPA